MTEAITDAPETATETDWKTLDPEYVEKLTRAVCSTFVEKTPGYQPTKENYDAMTAYVVEHDLDPTRFQTWKEAYEQTPEGQTRIAQEREAFLAAADREREAERERRRQEYNRPSSEDRSAMIEDVKALMPKRKPRELPKTNYTQAQMDAMSADEYRVKVLGEIRPDDQFIDIAANTKDHRTMTNERILRGRKKPATPLARAIRTQALTEELSKRNR